MRCLTALAASLLSLHAHAHGGHGIATDSHWHASDAYGFLGAAALVALAIWLSRGE
ncbi:MAG TPA: hypothetical protein VHL79_06115 [Ramlibacter sp.]|jgi:hypothetical protein|nr:hypothetical protein [Ramlibacter sp.]